jgi:hypothetical protein
MQEPAEWDSALQLIIDVLMTNGKLLDPPAKLPYPHIPLLVCYLLIIVLLLFKIQNIFYNF